MAAAEDAPGAMTQEHHQRRTCRGHRPFATEREAWLHYLAKLLANEVDPGQQVYRCRGCWHWHHGGTQVYSLGRLLAENGWTDDVH